MSLDEMERITREATGGPWKFASCGDIWSEVKGSWVYSEEMKCHTWKDIGTTTFYSMENSDAKFIAMARNNIDKLIKFARDVIETLDCDLQWGYAASGRVDIHNPNHCRKCSLFRKLVEE